MSNTGNQAPENTAMKSEFLERVSDIPVVNAAKEYGTVAYNQVKQMNRFTAAALSVAETTALYLAVTAKPFLDKVQPQAQYVDQLACKGLTTVEEKAPFLKKSPEELVADARQLCSSTIDLGYKKVEDMKTLSSDTLTSVKTFGLQTANSALSNTEVLLDKYLPPAFGEGSQEATTVSNSVPERATKLTSKIGLRLYGHGIKSLLPVHRLSQESVSKLVYTVELLQQLKENSQKSVQEYVDEAKVKATWIWEALNKEPAEASDAEKSLEQRMLSLARKTTSILVHAYNVASIPIAALPLPISYQDGLQTARRYAAEIFAQFDQATNAGEITSSLLQGLHEKLSALGKIIDRLTSQSETEEIEMENLEQKS